MDRNGDDEHDAAAQHSPGLVDDANRDDNHTADLAEAYLAGFNAGIKETEHKIIKGRSKKLQRTRTL